MGRRLQEGGAELGSAGEGARGCMGRRCRRWVWEGGLMMCMGRGVQEWVAELYRG